MLYDFRFDTVLDHDPIHPLDVIVDAWNLTNLDKITGSRLVRRNGIAIIPYYCFSFFFVSTMCVATMDHKLNQLMYANIGDCGLIVIRHIDSETAGYMRLGI